MIGSRDPSPPPLEEPVSDLASDTSGEEPRPLDGADADPPVPPGTGPWAELG
jgi:hypothetical protein